MEEILGTHKKLTHLLSCVAPLQSVDAQGEDCFPQLSVELPESLTAVPQQVVLRRNRKHRKPVAVKYTGKTLSSSSPSQLLLKAQSLAFFL